MDRLTFEQARREHAKAIESMRAAAAIDLTAKLGHGHWSGQSRIQSIRERIECGDPAILRRKTLFVACRDGEAIGSVSVSTFPPGFWRREHWLEPRAIGLGVFDLVVFPDLQGGGIGRFLMHAVEQLAMQREIGYVRLDAYSANPFSTGFYRRIGYLERAQISVRGTGLVLFEKPILSASAV